MLRNEDMTGEVIGAAIEVHRALGPGLPESAYEACLAHELALRGVPCRRQVPLRIRYKDLEIDDAYRMDLVVRESIVVEVKAVDKVLPVHEAQLLTYLRMSGLHVGLLLNFEVEVLRDGIVRKVL